MTDGISASKLSDDDLNRDLAQLDRTRIDIQSAGTDDQKRNHAQRSQELQDEAAKRRSASSSGSVAG